MSPQRPVPAYISFWILFLFTGENSRTVNQVLIVTLIVKESNQAMIDRLIALHCDKDDLGLSYD